MKYFINKGFGWVCTRCEPRSEADEDTGHSRLLREGEAESKNPLLSTAALAKWATPERDALVCPKCGITETL
ncbi:MAG TPA: hypothetical protein VGJ02_10780 [Pyrinomonadaceae bacterium]